MKLNKVIMQALDPPLSPADLQIDAGLSEQTGKAYPDAFVIYILFAVFTGHCFGVE